MISLFYLTLVGPCAAFLSSPSSSFLVGHTGINPKEKLKGQLYSFDAPDAMDAAGDLTSALSRVDKAWKIRQKSQQGSRWTRLVLTKDAEAREESMGYGNKESTILDDGSEREDFVYLLEPPNLMNPSCLIIFFGGAGLGTFPQVAYEEFLTRISNRMNAAIIAAPYPVALDHFQLSKRVGELARRAILHCEEDPRRLYNPKLPVYCLAHSLGCKLACIYAAATGQEFDGIGFVGFNNFGFGKTIGMAKEFAQSIQQQIGGGGGRGIPRSNENLDKIFDVAQTVLNSIGLEFSPSPADTERLVSLKFDESRVSRTRLFVLDKDNLDDSDSFIRACKDGGFSPEVSALQGNHLTPVYFKLDLNGLSEEARELARESLGGFESASFGNEDDLAALVEEVCGFLLGEEPNRSAQAPVLSASNNSDN